MPSRRDEPEENAAMREIRDIRRRMWQEAGNDPDEVLRRGRDLMRAKGFKPVPAKPVKRRRSA